MKNKFLSKSQLYFLTAFCIIISNSMIDAQVFSEKETQILDSLLIMGNIQHVSDYLAAKKSELMLLSDSSKHIEDFDTLKAGYERRIEAVKYLDSLSQEEIIQRVELYKSFQDRFYHTIVGEKAKKAYDEFYSLALHNDYIPAIRWYYYAYKTKLDYLLKEKELLPIKLKWCEDRYNEGKYDEALEIILCSECVVENIACDRDISFKVYLLKEKILSKITDRKLKENFFSSSETISNRFGVSLGVQAVFLSSNTSGNILFPYKLMGKDYSRIYEIKRGYREFYKFENVYSYAFLSSFSYCLNKEWEMQVYFSAGKRKFNLTDKLSEFKTQFNNNYYNVGISFDYFIRSSVGLRPYVGLGIHEFFTDDTYENNSKSIADEFFAGKIIYDWIEYIRSGKSWDTRIMLNIGAEYILPTQKNIVYELFTNFYYNVKNNQINSRYGSTIGFKVGYLF